MIYGDFKRSRDLQIILAERISSEFRCIKIESVLNIAVRYYVLNNYMRCVFLSSEARNVCSIFHS